MTGLNREWSEAGLLSSAHNFCLHRYRQNMVFCFPCIYWLRPNMGRGRKRYAELRIRRKIEHRSVIRISHFWWFTIFAWIIIHFPKTHTYLIPYRLSFTSSAEALHTSPRISFDIILRNIKSQEIIRCLRKPEKSFRGGLKWSNRIWHSQNFACAMETVSITNVGY